MIKVTKSTDDPRYSDKTNPRPVFNVTHAISSLEITEFVKVAVETGHLKAVLDGLPENYFTDARDNYYVVSKEGGSVSTHVYSYEEGSNISPFESACEDARERASVSPGTYRVMRIVYEIASQTQETYVIKISGERRL